jgi:hypothetical protein
LLGRRGVTAQASIWQAKDNLAFDFGVREAFTNGRPVSEIRPGVTFGFSLLPLSRPLQR